ncbi:MAG: phosphoenolpyruvate--protein phosphotransferase [Oscillospiraceae bacterium]
MKWQGKGVSEGLAMAQIHLFTPKLPEISRQPAADAEAEVAKLEKTLAAAEEELRGLYETAKEKMGEQEAEIFDAHLTILGDEYSVREPIIQRIREQKQNAAAAITDQFDELAQMFRSLGDELMAERAADAEDLKQQLLRICLGCGRQDLSVLPGDVIVLAEELTPSDTVRMDTAHVKGIATRLGGATAHSAIIARTLGIPAAAGIDGWQTEALNGHMAILDGADGTLTVDPTDEETACYQSRKAQADCEAQALEAFRTCPSQTKDGAALEICANIGTPQEAQQAMKYGADGVGLFRSEFLFMDRDALPTEDEQFEAYRMAAQTMAGKPLIIRTLDVGGDKKLPTLELPHEDNPFLGFRAIRMTLSHPEIFRPQLRAILRAAAYGDVRVMFPMIGSMDQLREAKALLREQEQTLQAEGVPTGPVKVGMMVEIPAAAVLAEEFAKEVDFFSIGTNDLTQYTLAVERGNAAVAHLYAPEHPAVLRLIAMTAQAAAERHIPCGMCGEAAGDPKLAPAFVGMGVNELSMSPRRVPAVRKLLSELTMDECRQAAEKLLHP